MKVIAQQFDPAIEVAELSEHPDNPRRGDAKAVAESMSSNGFYGAILVQKSSGRVIAGHTRLKVAREEGAETIPGIWLDVNDEEARRILLADNRTSDLAYYDDEMLFKTLASMLEGDGTLLGTGYDDDTYQLLLHNNTVDLPAVDAPDDAPAITQIGDIWLLGEHRLMCGDSSIIVDLDTLMNGKKADCVLTDPPYGINLDTDYGKFGKVGGRALSKDTFAKKQKSKKYKPVLGDSKPFDASHLYSYFTDATEQFWFGGDYYRRTIPDDDLSGSWLVWDKRNETSDAGFGSGFELIWSRNRHKRELLRFFNLGFLGVEASNRCHPTQKPTPLLKEIITRWTDEQAIIADPFAGSGSTLIAAHLTNRICYTMELDQHYCDIICARYQKQTGDLPRLEATGEVHNFLP